MQTGRNLMSLLIIRERSVLPNNSAVIIKSKLYFLVIFNNLIVSKKLDDLTNFYQF
jgi:hypothetical protein